ncbi:uncharacterized protein LOC126593392 isoform X4 [Malus sylvestris]|uniref:uncharacterized protein LOC126593392 isoform X4 n=1 Tax=Malus sylvestris TaxID=3752 RepID=UPI0021ACFB2C|nr:uncharacterized protein LOC126593392 isoform X4 [Malus sylvestris]
MFGNELPAKTEENTVYNIGSAFDSTLISNMNIGYNLALCNPEAKSHPLNLNFIVHGTTSFVLTLIPHFRKILGRCLEQSWR